MKKTSYVLDMFPYPSGEGLHMGHAKVYSASDIYSRYKRMTGYDVLHPTGFDAFGLPAEQYALKNKVNPNISTKKNSDNFLRQMKELNLSYDYDKVFSTTDPDFYRWTQWIFKQLYNKGLAHESFEPINWCPSCMTGLANEDLEDGKCERCGSVVEKKPLRQWVLKITDYADRLIDDLDTLDDWQPWVKDLQRNWIGRSEGSEIDFEIKGKDFENKFTVFTTRADTLFGCTYTVLSPEHVLVRELLDKNVITNKLEVEKYIADVKDKTDIERGAEGREKTGVKLDGVMAMNPANQKEVPVYIADYVLASYGTGAIMAVPAHDERDGEFAEKYGIEIKSVTAKHFTLTGNNAEREGCETLHKTTVDAIIRDKDNNYYIIKEQQGNAVHFVGGGVDGDESNMEAMKREIKEEIGFIDFEIKRLSVPYVSCWGFRHTKNKNQRTMGASYEVVLNSLDKVGSEIEEGKHELVVLKKEEVLNAITWPHHKYLFERYLSEIEYFTEDGVLINSGEFDGMTSEEARVKITEAVAGKLVKKYKLRDWVFARQRYWGEPFPIVFDENHKSYLVADSELPVRLPEEDSYEPTGTGESPLANISEFTDVYGYVNDIGEFESIAGKFKDIIKVGHVLPEAKKVEGSTVIAYDDNKKLFLKLKNLNTNETWLPSGGLNEGEAFQECALRELKEEAGISKIDKIIELGSPIYSYYFNANKNSNRESLGYNYLVYVDSEQEISFSHEDHEMFELEWVSYEDLYNSISETRGGVHHWAEALNRAKFVIEKKAKLFKRETNTMPQWAGSSWYWLRFPDAHNDKEIFSKESQEKFGVVDIYVGGVEHATRHLIYGRFWHKFLYDLGLVKNIEPFKRLETVGLVLGEGGVKMSKRLGNIINPDDVIREHGSDVARMYVMFMGPFGQTGVWDSKSISGVKRFLDRVKKLESKVGDECKNQNIIHQTVKKVAEDIEGFKFNTAISQMMILVNEFEQNGLSQGEYDSLMTILAPFAPETCAAYVDKQWPAWDESKLTADEVTIVIQINGKLRGNIKAKKDVSDEEILLAVKATEIWAKNITTKPKKVITIKNKLVNIVI